MNIKTRFIADIGIISELVGILYDDLHFSARLILIIVGMIFIIYGNAEEPPARGDDGRT